MRVVGFDPGRKYIAWALLEGVDNLTVTRHGMLFPPSLGPTADFGQSIKPWNDLVWAFLTFDLKPDVIGIERFVYTPGGKGAGAEEINLRIPAILGPEARLVRNVDWKSWFKRSVNADGAHDHFKLHTPHESDAAGIAMYVARAQT